MEDAIVVCRQLGYHTATSASTEEYFGQMSRSLWMIDVQCTGYETSLTECSQRPLYTNFSLDYSFGYSYELSYYDTEVAWIACEGK
ncbi:hypothetical protein HOLleu_21168 [Holothuria leucospilota]|uniref:SRCR domain-containing protein n=1 Tax=Holothuria leucospilota TaxID=206669 RepID=A0A9Q1BW22_HOLLE|nr:hypothetical protein HOLleu_21168 [Holothuria leucospilota]